MSESLLSMIGALQRQLNDLRREVESLKLKRVIKRLGIPCDSKRDIYYALLGDGSISKYYDEGLDADRKLFAMRNYFDSLEDVQAYKDMLIEWKNSLENAYESLPIGVKVLLPLLRKGWIAMDKSGNWYWYEKKPAIKDSRWETVESNYHILSAFNLEPAEDWQNSLMEVV